MLCILLMASLACLSSGGASICAPHVDADPSGSQRACNYAPCNTNEWFGCSGGSGNHMCMACNKVSECAYNAGKGYDDSSKRIRGDRAKWCHGDSLCEVCDVPSSAYCPAGRTPSRTPNDCKLGAGTCLHWRPGCDKNDDGLCDDYCGAG
jgi:hypothetical protein